MLDSGSRTDDKYWETQYTWWCSCAKVIMDGLSWFLEVGLCKPSIRIVMFVTSKFVPSRFLKCKTGQAPNILLTSAWHNQLVDWPLTTATFLLVRDVNGELEIPGYYVPHWSQVPGLSSWSWGIWIFLLSALTSRMQSVSSLRKASSCRFSFETENKGDAPCELGALFEASPEGKGQDTGLYSKPEINSLHQIGSYYGGRNQMHHARFLAEYATIKFLWLLSWLENTINCLSWWHSSRSDLLKQLKLNSYNLDWTLTCFFYFENS